MNRKLICEIINSEMEMATGCTEPAAIAFTAATAKGHLPGRLTTIKVNASVNIIKNAMAAGLPGTTKTGIAYAAALGAVGGDTDKQLQVIDHLPKSKIEEAICLIENGHVSLSRSDSLEKLYVDVTLQDEQGHTAKAVLAGTHTNIVQVEEDGRVVQHKAVESFGSSIPAEVIAKNLSIQIAYEFAHSLDRKTDDLHMVEQAIALNSAISKLGTNGNYGLNVGKEMLKAMDKGYIAKDLVTKAIADTASGIDARMAGTDNPVVTNSGSGNQGITATIPVLSAAKTLGISEDITFRAVTLSNLIGIYIHARFGRLSALCGATVAGTGVACGIVYLLGGKVQELDYVINNMLGNVTGMICDGAKADCALKVSTCVHAAFQSAFMAMDHVYVKHSDGIVENDAEKTIINFTDLGNKGSHIMDNLILDMLFNK